MNKLPEILQDMRDDAEAEGCWSSVSNILDLEHDDVPDIEQVALMHAMRNLHDLAREALDYADRIASVIQEDHEC